MTEQDRKETLPNELDVLLAKFDKSSLDLPQSDPMEQCDNCMHADVCAYKISRLHGLDVSQCEDFKPVEQWFSVKDEPPPNEFVFAWCTLTQSVEIAKYEGTLWRTQESRRALNADWITHWMPLPEPPKGE